MKPLIALLLLVLAGFIVFAASPPGPSLSQDEARCYNIASERAPTGKTDKDAFMSEYRACVARQGR